MKIRSSYEPRPYFMPFHLRNQRWALLVAHRRAGKTVAAVNDVVEKASRNTRKAPRYAYIAPLLRQAKDIAWQYLKEAAAPYGGKPNESGLYVELTALPNSPRITIYGADNPDSFRGIYLDGVVLDEFGNMVDSIWKEVLLPALIDRRGWAVFMGTPNGPNHFRTMFYANKANPDWHVSFMPHTFTNIIPEDAIAEMKKIMDPEQFAQEMLCSFEASVRGAIYARQIEQMEQDGRIGDFPLDNHTKTDIIMDLGYRDLTSMGFAQARPDGVLMGHEYSDNFKPIKSYIDYATSYISTNKLKMGKIWLPHDARARSLQTGKSIIDHFIARALKPTIVAELDVLDGIAATRKMFPLWWINEPECKTLILALKSYHRKYDPDRKVYSDEPVHDWASNPADMFRYASICQNQARKPETPLPRTVDVRNTHYGFALNDIWDTLPSHSGRIQ